MASPSRRDLLRTLGIGAAAAATGCPPPSPEILDWSAGRTPDPTAPWGGSTAVADALFPLGVQSGDPHPDGVLLWTRYDGTGALSVVVAAWNGGSWVEQETAPVTVEPDGYVHHILTGFPADQPLAFQFVDDASAASVVGHSRTAPAPDQGGAVRLGATSCTKNDHGLFPSLPNTVARGPLDAWLWLGDTVYAYTSTVTGYRPYWEENFQTPEFQSVMGAVPSLYTWDDHEVTNNWGGPTSIDADQLAAATQVFFEHNTVRPDPAHPNRLWRSIRMGRAVEIFVLDCRGERSQPNGTYLSPEQMQWLKDGLAASTATWKLIMNSVPITNMPAIADVPAIAADRWEGYPASRAELLDFLTASGLPGVLFVAGDFHMSVISRVEPTGPGADLLEVWVGPAGAERNPLGPTFQELEPDQFIWADAQWSCTRITLHPDGWAHVIYVGEDDESWCEATFDTSGRLWALDVLPPPEEE